MLRTQELQANRCLRYNVKGLKMPGFPIAKHPLTDEWTSKFVDSTSMDSTRNVRKK
jgi:hypothetical protein